MTFLGAFRKQRLNISLGDPGVDRRTIYFSDGEIHHVRKWHMLFAAAAHSRGLCVDYRASVNIMKVKAVVTGNTVEGSTPAIIVKESTSPAHVFANMAISKDENANIFEIQGLFGILAENAMKNEEASDGAK